MKMIFSKNTHANITAAISYPIIQQTNNIDYIKKYQTMEQKRFSLSENIRQKCTNCYK